MTLATKYNWEVKLKDLLSDHCDIYRWFGWVCKCEKKYDRQAREKICTCCFTWRPDFINFRRFWETSPSHTAGDVLLFTYQKYEYIDDFLTYEKYIGPKFVASLRMLATSVVLRNIPRELVLLDRTSDVTALLSGLAELFS